MLKYPVQAFSKDPKALHLYVRDIRILTPKEYDVLKNTIPKDRHRAILDILLITGMRYIELQRLWSHREWYNSQRNLIHLGTEAQKKIKRRHLERTIHPLPSMFNYILKDFFESKKTPTKAAWNRDLQRWAIIAGISPFGLSAKTTRKTIESWMIAAGIIESTVCLRQGHNSLTSMRHYQGLAFSDDELRDIRKQLTSWGLLK